MNRGLSLLGSLGLGAGLMYLFDPDRGNRRRALLRDKAVHYLNECEDFYQAGAHDLRNRAAGMVAEASHLFTRDTPSDQVLQARVRAILGRCCSHPRAIYTEVDHGKVILTGPVLREETDAVLRGIRGVRGVKCIEDRLSPHDSPENIASLQGRARRAENGQSDWTPAARLLACIGGTLLALYGLRQKNGLRAAALGMAGVALGARSVVNRELNRSAGTESETNGIEIQKTLLIKAPVDLVYAFWTNYANFPFFMSNVLEIQDGTEGMSHWVVRGPAGIPIEWDAEVTSAEMNRELGWKSLPGSVVENSGQVQFEDLLDGTTRVQIRLDYRPPAGVLGHTVADLLGFDPKSKMDEDLARMKTLIETGKPPRKAAKPKVRES